MEAEFTLAIPRGLDQSILLTILIGLLVMLILTETLGWVFVGVVVPGYLASIFIIQPLAGIAVVVDAILTFVIARGISAYLERVGSVVDFFGRERFFLIVLVSVLVRQQTQSHGLPQFGPVVAEWLGISGDVSLGFYSLGLVLVPLLANVLWKLDLRAGLFHAAAAVAVTYVILRWTLLPLTTLSYSALELTYENAAIDFFGNAKSYIIMLFTAYLAAHLNVRYGWDYNGVLVPSLLALLWLTPSKLGMSLLEAAILFLSARWILRVPGLRTLNLEGPRKMAFVFTLGLSFKWAIGTVVGPRFPDIKITDLYGFGYLLPSLLALKMLQKRAIRPVLLPTAVTSLLGFAGASAIGFALELLFPVQVPPRERVELGRPTRFVRTIDGVAALGHMRSLETPDRPPRPAELLAYQRTWDSIADWLEAPSQGTADEANGLAARLGLRIHRVAEQWSDQPSFALVEDQAGLAEMRGWDTAVLTPGAVGPVIEVPRPTLDEPAAEFGAALCKRLRCRALIIAGRRTEEDPTLASDSALQVVHRALARFPTVVVERDDGVPAGKPVLMIGADLPESVNLHDLGPGDIQLSWSDPAEEIPGWGRQGLILLRVRGSDMREQLRSSAAVAVQPTLGPWLRRHVHGEGNPVSYEPPARSELAFLDLMVARPALSDSVDLQLLAGRAGHIGYAVVRFDDCGRRDRCVAFYDTQTIGGGWATLIVRPSGNASLAVAVPRPHRHHGTAELGLELWVRSNGQALIVAQADHPVGPHPADPLVRGNVETSFQALFQAVDSRLRGPEALILLVAGFGQDQPLSTDVVVGLGHPLLDGDRIPPAVRSFLALDGALAGGSYRLADGSESLHKLTGSGMPPLEYALALGQAESAILWFAPWIRDRYLVRRHRGEFDRLERAGLSAAPLSEVQSLLNNLECSDHQIGLDAHEAVLERLRDYATSRNLHILREIQHRTGPTGSTTLVAGRGLDTGRPFLVLESRTDQIIVRSLVLLGPDVEEQRRWLGSEADKQARAALLERFRVTTCSGVVVPEVPDDSP